MKIVVVLVLFLCLTTCVPAYKILGIFHFTARSHFIVGSALMKGLARQGHEVTVISPFPQKEPLENYSDVTTYKVIDVMKEPLNNAFDLNDQSILTAIVDFYEIGLNVVDATLSEPTVQELMRINKTFDVVISEVFLSEALYGLAEHFNAPLIGLGTFGAISWNTDMVGSPSPPSYVPSALLKFTDHMTLMQRVANLGFATFDRLLTDLWYLPRQVALYNKYFPHLKRSLYDVRKNAALVLLNQHVSLSFPRPYVPNQVEVGGMHINRKRKPLPAKIQKFLDEAPHGAIYFSMGSNLKSKDIPLEKREAILSTFRGLKQRVLWKFEDANLPNKPDNVFISDWFPQDDILAHKNVKAFITHGGLLSTTESIYHGKPFVGIPIFGDQFLNMGRAEMYGYGIQVNYKELTKEALQSAIDKILNDPSYTNLVRDMSTRYRDQPIEPLDLAIYWVEHVVRNNGAKYLHCAGLDLNFIEYHNIDAIIILYGGICLVFVLIFLFLRLVIRTLIKRVFYQNKKVKRQ